MKAKNILILVIFLFALIAIILSLFPEENVNTYEEYKYLKTVQMTSDTKIDFYTASNEEGRFVVYDIEASEDGDFMIRAWCRVNDSTYATLSNVTYTKNVKATSEFKYDVCDPSEEIKIGLQVIPNDGFIGVDFISIDSINSNFDE